MIEDFEHAGASYVLSMLKESKHKFYLFGSRLVETTHPDSDTDIVAIVSEDITKFLFDLGFVVNPSPYEKENGILVLQWHKGHETIDAILFPDAKTLELHIKTLKEIGGSYILKQMYYGEDKSRRGNLFNEIMRNLPK